MPAPVTTIPVKTTSVAYDVVIGSGILASVAGQLDELLQGDLHSGKRRCFVVSSPEIWQHWGQQLASSFRTKPTLMMVDQGERHKRLSTVERLAEEMAAAGADRGSVLIAFGGGVVGDMTGFLASMYMRGIPYVQIPTTLLAQVDSSIGGKTGVNLLAGKNLIGAFHHPLAVFVDPDVLSSLPKAELRAGLQESIKAGIIRDKSLFEFFEDNALKLQQNDPEALMHVVAASIRVKAAVVGADEREAGLRMILNFGHTLGHAIEAATGYTQLLHGEAVAWGMLAAIAIAERRGTVSSADARRMIAVIRAFGAMKPFSAEPEHLVALTAKDKKNRSGTRSFVLPVGIGDAVVVHDIEVRELLDAAIETFSPAQTAIA